MPVAERVIAQEVFGFLRPEQINAISNAAEVIRYQAGDTVYFQGEKAENLFVVLQGGVSLRLPGKEGVSVPIDEASKGALFGSCLCFGIDAYATTAQCTQDSELMRIGAVVLMDLLDEDPIMGYAIQRRMSQVYFRRYLETMRKLQAIVMNLPLEAE